MPKRSIRAQLLAERRARPIADCEGPSEGIQQRFLYSDFFRRASCMALYSAIQNEVLTDAVSTAALATGKKLVYPRVNGAELEFVSVRSLEELAPGAYGVLEPTGSHTIEFEDLDLVVVPGVAFDECGHRLGYGRGFYDRALLNCRTDCVKVGFAYDFQLLKDLPSVAHDQKLSVLMTESQTLNFNA